MASLSPLRRLLDVEGSECRRCGVALGEQHAHLADLEGRRLLCVCIVCAGAARIASDRGVVSCRVVPERSRALPEDALNDADWDAAQIPVGIAFFFYNTRLDQAVVCYPGPAGATESQLPLEHWNGLLQAAGPFESDVQALLVRRTAGRREAFVVPITTCYELVGRIRRSWRGFGGGMALTTIDAFFDALRARCVSDG